jgi:hypothetical protein
MGKQITDYLLYRWRYILGYGVISLMVIGLLVVAGLYIPGGLSQPELKSVVTSNALSLSFGSFDPSNIINLPYHLLQRLSLHLFGVSAISIKLPSLLLGLLSAFGLLLLLRMWFRQNVAVLTTILVITTGQFLFIAQNGTPSIVYVLGSIWLLVAALKVSRNARWAGIWKLILFGIVALSLYTPLSLYILIALVSAIILHPHLRYLVRRLSKVKIVLACLCSLIILAPLAYIIVRHPSVGLTLLGVPDNWPNLLGNFVQLLRQYFDFVSPSSGSLMTPIYGLGSMMLIALGVFRLATTKYTARSYIISAWIILLLPILIINPNFVSVTFVPIVLLMAMGISTLITNWYTLFPRNPYARLAGLIPLIVLIGGMVFSGVDRYVYGYLYSPQTANNFSNDLRLLNKQLSDKTRGNTALIVAQDETAFYSVVAHHHDTTSVVSTPVQIQPDTTTVIVSRAVHITSPLGVPYQIVTDSTTHDADRFYIYKTDSK